ncbi:hypothetical protein TUM17564_21960 [Citrobacter freundii]|nr:hypothetical protein TUM17564_21960 [Citrobacter freundii]
MKVAAKIQSTNAKAAARVKDITTKAATTSTMQAAAKVKNIAMKAVTKITTTSMAAGTATVAAAVVVANASSVTENYAWSFWIS